MTRHQRREAERKVRKEKRRSNAPRARSKVPLALAIVAALGAGGLLVHRFDQEQSYTAQSAFTPFSQSSVHNGLTPEIQQELANFVIFEQNVRDPLPLDLERFKRFLGEEIQAGKYAPLNNLINEAMASNNGSLPVVLEKVVDTCAVELIKAADLHPKFTKRTSELTADLAQFLDEPGMRDVPLTVVQSPEDVQERGIYLVKRRVQFVQTIGLHIRDSPIDLGPLSYFTSPKGSITYTVDQPTATLTQGKIIIAYDGTLGDGYNVAAPAEAIHSILRLRSEKRLRHLLATGTYSEERMQLEIIHEEEVFAHALQMIWIDLFALKHPEAGIPSDYSKNTMSTMEQRLQYAGITEMYRRLRVERGIDETIEQHVQRQQQVVLSAKERFRSLDPTMFDFLYNK